jgi:hypothetical protein
VDVWWRGGIGLQMTSESSLEGELKGGGAEADLSRSLSRSSSCVGLLLILLGFGKGTNLLWWCGGLLLATPSSLCM